MISLDRWTSTFHAQKSEYYLEVEGLKGNIFESLDGVLFGQALLG